MMKKYQQPPNSAWKLCKTTEKTEFQKSRQLEISSLRSTSPKHMLICLKMTVLYTPPRVRVHSARTVRSLMESARTLRSPCALRTDFAESARTPHGLRSPCRLCMTLGCPCGLRTKIALSRNWTRVSTPEPIATTRSRLYHYTMLACTILLTCAIYVTCSLIGLLYSKWDIWYVLDQFFNVNSVVVSISWSG